MNPGGAMLHGISSPAPYLARLSRQMNLIMHICFQPIKRFGIGLSRKKIKIYYKMWGNFFKLLFSAVNILLSLVLSYINLTAEFDFDAHVVRDVDFHYLSHGPFIGFDSHQSFVYPEFPFFPGCFSLSIR